MASADDDDVGFGHDFPGVIPGRASARTRNLEVPGSMLGAALRGPVASPRNDTSISGIPRCNITTPFIARSGALCSIARVRRPPGELYDAFSRANRCPLRWKTLLLELPWIRSCNPPPRSSRPRPATGCC
ncbi:hypothetical protein GWG65_31765 [Bradyrhizobium sp. CSA207]|nr:hypothetical protein [Bradyrhizobium sp. CSA207]